MQKNPGNATFNYVKLVFLLFGLPRLQGKIVVLLPVDPHPRTAQGSAVILGRPGRGVNGNRAGIDKTYQVSLTRMALT